MLHAVSHDCFFLLLFNLFTTRVAIHTTHVQSNHISSNWPHTFFFMQWGTPTALSALCKIMIFNFSSTRLAHHPSNAAPGPLHSLMAKYTSRLECKTHRNFFFI